MFKIKNFGKDEVFSSVEEMKEALSTKYLGMHVSIVFKTKSNLLSTLFVSVDSDGKITESYGDMAEVDFSKIA